jgi:hypothetical protein
MSRWQTARSIDDSIEKKYQMNKVKALVGNNFKKQLVGFIKKKQDDNKEETI